MLKAIVSWVNDRTGIGECCAWLAESPVIGRVCCCKAMPCAILFAFCIQAVTGFFLWAFYSPSAQTAWESVHYLQYNVAGGWILRAMHHYSAHVLLALLMIAIVQEIFTYAYRAPRELVFWATIGLGLCALAAILTGDLLSWDQNGYASTKTRTSFLTLIPLVGDSLLKIAIGGPGPELGSLAVTRFFALHVGVFGAGFIALLIVRGYLARRASAKEAAGGNAMPYWPGQMVKNAAACWVVLFVVLVLSFQHGFTLPNAGVPQLSPADTNPANGYNAARPEWFLVGVFEFSHLFPGGSMMLIPIFIVPGLLVAIALAMPFLAKYVLGHLFNMAFTVALLVALIGLSIYSLAKDRDSPEHQRAIAQEEQQARRVCELVRYEGVPATGALTLLQNDAKTQGPRLFTQNCASCHDHVAGEKPLEDIKAEKSSAPNLAGFASRPWITGLLDPKQISGPKYFGDTKFRNGKMAGFVKETLTELDDDAKKNLRKVIVALSAEATLPSQREADVKEAAMIEEGRKLIMDGEFGCTDCHQFHGKGGVSDIPNLTGYGSAEWISGIIRNPADKRFYSKFHDRMPAYAEDTLNPKQVQMLTDWLRGDWYDEKRDEE
jgi:ubiquinol-cytochrome c reductase cytochrome b subunit